MGDPAGYLDEGKGLPWITMDIAVAVGVQGTSRPIWAACGVLWYPKNGSAHMSDLHEMGKSCNEL